LLPSLCSSRAAFRSFQPSQTMFLPLACSPKKWQTKEISG
jgi:hypothetical protein